MRLRRSYKSLRALCLAGIFFSSGAAAQNGTRLGANVTYRGYMSNYEYFTPVVPGFTLFGNVLEPAFTLRPDSSWTLQAGAWLQQDFGNNGFRRAEPDLCLRFVRRNVDCRFGNVDVYGGHGLQPWLYDGDDFITRGPAYGAQFKNKTYRLNADAWIAWRRMIYLESVEQERIEAGVAAEANLADTAALFNVYMPMQGIVLHNGGQIGHIDTVQRVVTLYGVSAGLGLTRRFDGAVRTVGAEATVSACNNEDVTYLPIGTALATKAFATLRNGIGFEAAWWVGDNFFVPTGTPLYQSRSSVYAHDTLYFNQRQLLFLTATWQRDVANGLTVGAWVQPYYDVNLKLLEYGYRLRLTYAFDALLKRFD